MDEQLKAEDAFRTELIGVGALFLIAFPDVFGSYRQDLDADGRAVWWLANLLDAVSRFLRDLEIRPVEGQNSALADLFDLFASCFEDADAVVISQISVVKILAR